MKDVAVDGLPVVDWFETMASTVTDQMAYIDRHQIFRAVNRAYLDSWARRSNRPDLRVEDLVDKDVADVLPASLVDGVVRPNLARCLAGYPVSLQRWFQVGGESWYLHVQYHPHRGADGAVLGAVVVIRDNTATRRSQLRLRELASSEEVLAGDIEAVAAELVDLVTTSLGLPSAAVWHLDLEPPQLRSVATVNYRDDIEAMPRTLALGDFPRFMQALADGNAVDAHEALIDPRTRELGDVWLRPRRILSILVVPVMVGGNLAAVLWLESGSELRIWQASDVAIASEAAGLLAQAVLHRQRHELEQRLVEGQKREGLGVLAGGLAHDFNNLLVGILGGADLLHRQSQDQPEVQKRLELIRSAARRASDLCSQMLAYAGKGRLQSRRADLSELTEGTVKLLRSSLADHVDLHLELAPDLPAIEVDLTQVRQVVMNLVLNAAEALGDEPGEVRVRTDVVEWGKAEEHAVSLGVRGFVGGPPGPGTYVRLRVADTGCGMEAATLERIFDPFFTTKFTGRGLGMAAVLGIVRSHHGGIRIETALGAGSRLEILFPAVSGVAETRAPAGSGHEMPSEHLGGRQPRVLVVDDEEVVRLIAREMLNVLDCEVLMASDGAQAMELFERHGEDLDLVVLDVTMPLMSGEEVLSRVHRRRPDLPVVIASGFSKEDLGRRFAGHDVIGFIHKPYQLDELSQLIHQALAR